MEKKPVNIVVKDATEAAKRLNEMVEKGGYNFSIGVNKEYAITISKNSDGSTSETKERRYRIVGMVDTYVGEELDSLNAVRDDLKAVKKEREEMNRTLNVMNKSAFAPISILLLGVAIITLVLGILTLAKILPLPAGQIPIAIVLVVVGALALAGSFVLFFFRRKKKLALLERKDEILKSDNELKTKENEINLRVPQWYKEALWEASGSTLKNFSQTLVLKD